MTTVNGLGELNEFDHSVATDGNVQVDFVWGNFPLQPDDNRGGEGQSDTLDITLDNHIIADIGWSNFPGYIPNYEGDEDSQLEFVVPDLLRLTRNAADDLLSDTNLDIFATGHNLTVFSLESRGTGGKTVRVAAYDESNPQDGGYLNGLRVGDFVIVDNNESDFGGEVKVTAINEDGENSWFEFKTATNLNLDTSVDGTVYAGSNLVDVVTIQRFWNASGSIKNPGTNIHVRYFDEAPVAPAAAYGPTTDWRTASDGMGSIYTYVGSGVSTAPAAWTAIIATPSNYNVVVTGGTAAGTYPMPPTPTDQLDSYSSFRQLLLYNVGLPADLVGSTYSGNPAYVPNDAGTISIVLK